MTFRTMGAVFAVLFAGLTIHPVSQAIADDCAAKVNLKASAERSGVLAKMIAATKLAGLDDPTIDTGPMTLFAPSDAAFDALPEGVRKKLLSPEYREQLAAVLMHHAIPGTYPMERLMKARVPNYTVGAVDGSEVEITTSRGIDIAGAKIIQGDIIATDGIIHVIDKVLIPLVVQAELNTEAPIVAEVVSTEP
jgi:uncharacterized surface protein with fasciclin (FAS1) repeats